MRYKLCVLHCVVHPTLCIQYVDHYPCAFIVSVFLCSICTRGKLKSRTELTYFTACKPSMRCTNFSKVIWASSIGSHPSKNGSHPSQPGSWRAKFCCMAFYHLTYFTFLSPLALLNTIWRLTFSGRMRKACNCRHPLTHKRRGIGKCTEYSKVVARGSQ